MSRNRRYRRVLFSASLSNGANEVVDFILPLMAGQALGFTPSAIAVLVAVELILSMLARPIAGRLSDVFDPKSVAAIGALICGMSYLAFAYVQSFTWLLLLSGACGVGGALLWIAMRSVVGEQSQIESDAFSRLYAAEELGSWVIFVPAILLYDAAGRLPTFCFLAAVFLVVCGVLATASKRPASSFDDNSDVGLFRRFVPMLFAMSVAILGESYMGLLLLLHLQFNLGLTPIQIALVFLPGAIIASILPKRVHRLVVRYGRGPMIVAATACSAVFALVLIFVRIPEFIAVAWMLTALSWATIVPIYQTTTVGISPYSAIGRALGWLEMAGLAGAIVGTALAGPAFSNLSWSLACLVGAGAIALGCIVGPGMLRIIDHSSHEAFRSESRPLDGSREASGEQPREIVQDETSNRFVLPEASPIRPPQGDDKEHSSSRQPRQPGLGFLVHFAVFVVVVSGAVARFDIDLSGLFKVPDHTDPNQRARGFTEWIRFFVSGEQRFLSIIRVWGVILILDFADTLHRLFRMARRV